MNPDNDKKRSLEWEGKEGNPPIVLRTNHLLVIGIDAYKYHPPLNNARKDAETFRDILLDRYQFERQNVTEIFDEKATLRNILTTLSSLEHKLKNTDNLVIYFSGHGSMNRRKTQGFWVPAEAEKNEADYIANDRVRAILGDMEAHHIYMIVDACFSGSMILRSAETATELLEQYPSRRVLTSGRQQEAVSDGKPGSHSPFFACIREQLIQPAGGLLSALELENHVIKNTPRSAFQLPEAAMIFGTGDQSGKFVFYPKKDENRDWEEVKKENTISSYGRYIQTYPNGRYLEEAAWAIAQLADDKPAYRKYIDQYPSGKYVRNALTRMDYLDQRDRFELAKRRGEAALRQFLLDFPEGPFAKEARAEITRIVEAENKKTQVVPQPKKKPESAKVETPVKRVSPPSEEKQKISTTARARTDKEPPLWITHKNQIGWGVLGSVLLFVLIGWLVNQWQGNKTGIVNVITQPQTDTTFGIVMVKITGGTFDMGSEKYDSEKPLHRVTISDFWMGKTEVTVAQFEAFIAATGYKTDAEKGDGSYIWTGSTWEKKAGVNWRCDVKGNIRPESEWNHPVIHVSWNDAKAYCDWLSERTGQKWRLPTEAEWEYAAGDGSSNRTIYAGTDSESELGDYAWYTTNTNNTGTRPVGQKKPNRLGLYDMSGNVWEWCSDWYGNYPSSDISDPKGPESGSFRVLRGGSWYGDASDCRVAFRSLYTPGVRSGSLGFRPTRTN
ncbi:MAG: SUMF1/EgtB/PvdO family nonheme iron enzyme [Bacteroidia bacterium]|nr:SUMF1/EgtB/PvdO family nonheme iron enzyme [Bacteroidia bacterium]